MEYNQWNILQYMYSLKNNQVNTRIYHSAWLIEYASRMLSY